MQSCLDFSAHSLVRYLERCVDREAVAEARRRYRDDGSILQALEPHFAAELRKFKHVIQVAYFNLLSRVGGFVDKAPFFLNVGAISVRIAGSKCLTTLYKHHDAPPHHPGDDDPELAA